MEINLTIRGEEKFRAFVEEHALIGYDAARSDLEEQFLADEKAATSWRPRRPRTAKST